MHSAPRFGTAGRAIESGTASRASLVARMSAANPGSAVTHTPGQEHVPRIRHECVVCPRYALERCGWSKGGISPCSGSCLDAAPLPDSLRSSGLRAGHARLRPHRKRGPTPLFLRVLCVLRGSAQRKVRWSEAPALGFLRQPNLPGRPKPTRMAPAHSTFLCVLRGSA